MSLEDDYKKLIATQVAIAADALKAANKTAKQHKTSLSSLQWDKECIDEIGALLDELDAAGWETSSLNC